MKSEIWKRPPHQLTFITSVLSDWFNKPSTRPLIGRNLRHISWLKLFFWGRRKQCKISFLGLFSKVRGFWSRDSALASDLVKTRDSRA